MNRRQFLSTLGAGFLAAVTPAYAKDSPHPLARLTDINTGTNFRPSPDKFSLVIFMTAQQNYPSCGGAFIGLSQVIDMSEQGERIQPILVMPRISDQSIPSDHRNLARATSYDVGFTILTGELNDVIASARDVGAYFELDAQGKVNGHTLDAYFLTPSGKKLFRHLAEDNFTMTPLTNRLLSRCSGLFQPDLCQ